MFGVADGSRNLLALKTSYVNASRARKTSNTVRLLRIQTGFLSVFWREVKTLTSICRKALNFQRLFSVFLFCFEMDYTNGQAPKTIWCSRLMCHCAGLSQPIRG